METLMLLTYITFCWIIFKVFKIPVNKWSITTAVLGGVVLLGSMLMGMAYFHPGSLSARTYFVTTGIVPNVKGKVVEVDVKANEYVEAGTVLFKIDETLYRARFDDLTAQLKYAERMLKDTKRVLESAGGSKFDVFRWEKEVSSLKAKLVEARFNLDSCTVKAPHDGFATQIRVKSGQMAVTVPFMPAMVFVDNSSGALIAGFSQEPIQNVKPGDPAEVIFTSIPGETFQGKVRTVLPALAEGQLSIDRNLKSLTQNLPVGQIPVIIDLNVSLKRLGLPLGVEAEVAVYGAKEGFWSHVAIIRKILLRMKSWSNYLRFH